ncbi:LacI family DNA-binding transcriptional regulator [Saccharothrix luteola]|uniref:LacI family DNA-binding transcriptional regulator n=1 Tax=Saccharothrix luteola TaxID=2893018 RepID=UPI001E521C25|nr:LacI family DNA-binding transcriptional regulator [Saccharothrix luteola]MCC8250112.1 LacI family DNA-binding transcriptional regulator [Saccharothrix luteola]
MARPGGPVTIRQVALHAGVSRQTVSNVLNAPDRVDPATRRRVRASVEALGYRPNRNARNLAARRAGLIGYCVPVTNTPSSFMDRFLHLLTAEVEGSGRHVLLFTSATNTAGAVDAYADLVAQRAVDGFVLANTVDQDPRHQWLADHDVPFVSFGRTGNDDQPGPWVDLDGAAVCHRLVDRLHDLGRSRIAFVGGRGTTAQNLERLRGWKAGCTAFDLPADRLVFAEADTVEAGGVAMRDLLDSEVIPDAVIAVSDPLAVGVHREVRRQGLRPGTDVAVTGFDDSPLASVVDGGLTSVRQPVERFARTVVDLLESTTGANGDRGVLLPGEIISRGSAPIRLTEQDLNEWESR